MKLNRTLVIVIVFVIFCLAACSKQQVANTPSPTEEKQPEVVEQVSEPEWVDYVSMLKLDMSSETVKQEVKVRNYVDGDTTHFYVPESFIANGVLKARYLAINTPESTGKIEEYGKKASEFTKSKLENAVSIIVESDDDKLNLDSTGSRHLVWVWYKEPGDDDYRNLNLEILQNGLAIASSSANNRYGSFCMSAIAQAKANKLNVYSGEKDPDFYYGEAVELTLKELRTNIEQYDGIKVAFEGVVTSYYNNGIFVEDYDPELDMYFGMYVYIGFGLNGMAQTQIDVGNRSRIVGTVSYYETGGTWQVSGLSYKASDPTNPNNIRRMSDGWSAAYYNVEPQTFTNGVVRFELNDEVVERRYANLALGSSVEIDNLYVVSTDTTVNEDSSSYGAMTLHCVCDGVNVNVRTGVLTNKDRSLITSDRYLGKNINVKGLVDYYDGDYQVKVLMADKIIINE